MKVCVLFLTIRFFSVIGQKCWSPITTFQVVKGTTNRTILKGLTCTETEKETEANKVMLVTEMMERKRGNQRVFNLFSITDQSSDK